MRKSGRARYWIRWRVPRESRSSPTAPTTRISPADEGRLAATSADARGPFASHVPLPWRRPPSRRTGKAPSTVSMEPRNTIRGEPRPMRAIASPTSSVRTSNPRAVAASVNLRTARCSSPEGLYSSTRARRTSRSSMRKRPSKRVERPRPLLVRDDEGRQEAHDARAGADREDAIVLKRLEHRRGLPAELDSDHESQATHFADRGRVETSDRVDADGTESLRAFRELFSNRVFDRRGTRGAGERIPAERGRVTPLERAFDLFARQGRPDRHPARKGLRKGEEVRFHIPSVDREEPPRPAHPRLDFVDDQEGSRPVARLACRGEVLRRGDVNASLPLYGLQDERGGVPVHGLGEGFDVVEGPMLE